MAGISATITDKGTVEGLNRLLRQTQDLAPVMEDIGATLRSFVDLCFRASRDPWGQQWKALSQVTLARRRGRSAQILRDTGRLANSITYKATDNSVAVGTNVVYGAAHQFGMPKGFAGRMRNGAPIPWGDIPARPFLPIRQSGKAELPSLWQAAVTAALVRHLAATV